MAMEVSRQPEVGNTYLLIGWFRVAMNPGNARHRPRQT